MRTMAAVEQKSALFKGGNANSRPLAAPGQHREVAGAARQAERGGASRAGGQGEQGAGPQPGVGGRQTLHSEFDASLSIGVGEQAFDQRRDAARAFAAGGNLRCKSGFNHRIEAVDGEPQATKAAAHAALQIHKTKMQTGRRGDAITRMNSVGHAGKSRHYGGLAY